MSFEFVLRIIGMITLAIVGGYWGYQIPPNKPINAVILTLVGALAGLILTPYFTTRPAKAIRSILGRLAAESLFAALAGLIVGLLIAALLAFPLSMLPRPFSQILPFIGVIIFSYVGISLFVMRQGDIMGLLSTLSGRGGEGGSSSAWTNLNRNILLDTSVIIDGRITDISKTRFIRSGLLVPSYVLHELQHIADSADSLRRNRGRRGLEVLRILQQESPVPVKITDMDVSEVRDVDSKLVALARELHCPIMTNDYNLNRVAELQGVVVLNINDLANAVKAAFLPGEELQVRIIQEGKEYGQGVGYLEDGTMVVVEDGRSLINDTVSVTVTKVLQTTAGRMIFARP